MTAAVPARRADIQGLRAVAVIAVLLFHIGGWFGGGYIGVDIFFVISGYVISMAYLEKFVSAPDLQTTFLFFQRRILRLAPALIVAVAATFILTQAVLPPTENKFFSLEAGLAALTQKANIYFAETGTNYWINNLSRNPFLHTWSLGVEWQFYAIFPLPFLAYGLARRFSLRPHIVVPLAALGIVLIGSLWLFFTANPTSAFFGPWSRFWQFALGIFAYLLTRRRPPAQDNSVLSVALLAGVLALALLPTTVLLQAPASALASLLIAVLLYTGASSNTGVYRRLLTSAPFQAVGYASYSIYLTHWPVAVFGRLALAEGFLCDVLLLLVSLGTGFLLSWTVEYRFMHVARPARAAFVCLAVAVLAFVAQKRTDLIPSLPWYSNPPAIAHVDGYHNFWWIDIDGASDQFRHSAEFKSGELFRRLVRGTYVREAVAARGAQPGWILGIGNSYIQSAGAMLRRYALDEGLSLALYDISECGPQNLRCTQDFEYVITSFESRKDQIELIYIAFRGLDAPDSAPAKLLPKLLSRLEHPGLRVVIQGPTPHFAYDTLSCLSLLQRCAPTQFLPVEMAQLEAGERRLESLFLNRPRLAIWSPLNQVCKDGMCPVRQDGASLFMDTDHFSNAGQRVLYPHLRAILKSPGAR